MYDRCPGMWFDMNVWVGLGFFFVVWRHSIRVFIGMVAVCDGVGMGFVASHVYHCFLVVFVIDNVYFIFFRKDFKLPVLCRGNDALL